MLDYWLNKLFFDLHSRKDLAEDYRRDRGPVLANYRLSPEMLKALSEDDPAAVYPFTNPFLVRYYFFLIGMTDQMVIERLKPLRATAGDLESAHG